MNIELNKIYRFGNSLVRVADIKGDEVTLNTGAITKAENLAPAIPMGAIIRERSTLRPVAINEDRESISDDTVIAGTPIFKENGESNIVVDYLPENKVKDELLTELDEFFDNANYTTSTIPLANILGEWKRNKGRLLKLLRLSPAWNEDNLCLVWDVEVPDRQRRYEAKDLYIRIMNEYRARYNVDYTHCIKYDFDCFLNIEDNKIFKEVNIKIPRHAKPSRALRRYFEAVGVTRIDDFEKLYAQLSDALSDKPIRRKLTLSVHPMDFLRMSYGNSWDSCHHIGNRGCYSNGALSYLMDESAMVCTLLSPNDTEPYWENAKINRMMFFLNKEGDILQSRLYPQTRIPELEAILAKEVSAKLQEVLKIEGAYKAVVSDTKCDDYVWSIGAHYHDYDCRDFGQNIWSVKDKPGRFKIGHAGICVYCGKTNPVHNRCTCGCSTWGDKQREFTYYICPNSGQKFTDKSEALYNEADGKYYLEYYTCPECGAIHFDKNELYCPECRKTHKMACSECGKENADFIVFDGRAYCPECAFKELAYCEHCGKLEYRSKLRWCDEQLVCDDCLGKNENLHKCEDCGEYFIEDDMYYVEGYGYICRSCRDDGEYYTCDDCGNLCRSDDGSWVGDDFICNDCLDQNYRYCERCNEYCRKDEATYIESRDEWVCDWCLDRYYTRCDCCEEYVRNDDIHDIDGENICDSCFESEFARCADCGEIHKISEVEEVDGEYICEDCLSKREEEENGGTTYGILTRDIDARFREGQKIRIIKSASGNGFIKIGLEDGDMEIFRFVTEAMIKSA